MKRLLDFVANLLVGSGAVAVLIGAMYLVVVAPIWVLVGAGVALLVASLASLGSEIRGQS